MTLYEALTRAFPYGEIERYQTPVFHTAKAPTRLNPNIPPWLESLILRAIAVDPERRYCHYSEVAFGLTHPAKVEPFFQEAGGATPGSPRFYKAGFFILLAATLYLLWRLLHH